MFQVCWVLWDVNMKSLVLKLRSLCVFFNLNHRCYRVTHTCSCILYSVLSLIKILLPQRAFPSSMDTFTPHACLLPVLWQALRGSLQHFPSYVSGMVNVWIPGNPGS